MAPQIGSVEYEIDQASANLIVTYEIEGDNLDANYWLNPIFSPEDADPSAYLQQRYIEGHIAAYGREEETATFDLAGSGDGDTFMIEHFFAEVSVSLSDFNKTNPDRSNWELISNNTEAIELDFGTVDQTKVYVDSCVDLPNSEQPGAGDELSVTVNNDNDVGVTAIVEIVAGQSVIGESSTVKMDPNTTSQVDIPVQYPQEEGSYEIQAIVSEAY